MALVTIVASHAWACAVRTNSSEHYFGPVMYRSAEPPDGRVHLLQTRHLGALFESGTQWGIVFGLIDRIAAAPLEVDAAGARHECDGIETHWKSALGDGAAVDGAEWEISLFHLSGLPRRRPEFVARSIVGGELGFGTESRAATLGYSQTAVLTVPDDQISDFDYCSDAPLSTRFERWKRRPGESHAAILQPKGE